MADEADTQYRAILRTDTPDTLSAVVAGMEGCLGTEYVDEESRDRTDLPDRDLPAGTVIAYFEAAAPEAELEIRRRIDDALTGLEAARWVLAECSRYTDRDWQESWKDYFEPIRLSERLGVGPPWHADAIPDPDSGASIVVEPGMAFGTGQHETSQLAAELLDERLAETDPDDAPDVLDVGCGSGILAMGAAELGAGAVVGVDLDEEALESARDNLRRNGLEERVDIASTPVEMLSRRFDVVVANILAPELLEIREGLVDAVRGDGTLILSGVPAARRGEFLDTFVGDRLQLELARDKGDWVGYILTRHPPDEPSA